MTIPDIDNFVGCVEGERPLARLPDGIYSEIWECCVDNLSNFIEQGQLRDIIDKVVCSVYYLRCRSWTGLGFQGDCKSNAHGPLYVCWRMRMCGEAKAILPEMYFRLFYF